MAFKHILLALDRTEKADQVLEQGVSLAAQYDACLTLIHSINETNVMAAASAAAPTGAGVPWPGSSMSPLAIDPADQMAFDRNLDHQVEVAQKWLRQYVQKAYDAGCEEAVPIVRLGDPSNNICDLADELEVDLIVVGRKDRSGLEELLLGSVSSAVVHNAPCAVLVAQT